MKTTYFYLILFRFNIFHFVSFLLLFDFYFFGFLSRFRGFPGRFRVGSGWFRVGSGWFRVVPGGSGRFRVGSVFYIHPTKAAKSILAARSQLKMVNVIYRFRPA